MNYVDDRYFVDEREGCVAVIDKETKTDKLDYELNEHTSGVVRYWSGECDGKDWSVPDEYIRAAHDMCDELNGDN